MAIRSNTYMADVSASNVEASGTAVGGPCRIRGLHFNDTAGGTAGSVTLKDGGSGGTTKLVINTPGGGVGEDVVIPGSGILFETDVYVTLTNVDAATVFFQR